MDNTAYLSAKQIRLKQKAITSVLATLATESFSNADLQQAYTLFSDADEYLEYVGKLYTSPPDVAFEGGGGADAAGTAEITGGILTAVNITDPGHDYTSAPEIVFSGGGGKGASAFATLSGSGDTVASATVVHESIVARLKSKSMDLDTDFLDL